jgi:hypothetical protein
MFWASCYMTGICGARHYRVQNLVMYLCIYRESCDIQHWMIWKTPLTSKWLRSPVNFTITYAKSSKSPCISPSGKQKVWHYELLLSIIFGTGTMNLPLPLKCLILNGHSRWNLCYFTTQQYLSSCHPGTFSMYISKATVHILCHSAMPIIFYCIS